MLAKPRKRKMSQSSDDNEKKPKRPRKTSSKVNTSRESCIVKNDGHFLVEGIQRTWGQCVALCESANRNAVGLYYRPRT